MDFLDPKNRRSYNIRLFVGFVLISIAIVLGTTILALITAGYSINRKTGQVIQNSLVFLNSQPVSSSIFLNGTSYGNTNARLELGAGSYSILLSQNSYRSWTHNLVLYGGEVEQLIYPFLFPSNPKISKDTSISSEPSFASASPDRHWMIIPIPSQIGNFYLIDITNPKTPLTTIAVPSNVFPVEPGTNTLTPVEWSTDNQHLLIKDSFQGGEQYVMLDRSTPANSINISQLFSSTTFTSISLDNKAFDKLYLFNQPSGTLSLGDVNTKAVTSILSNVISYWPYSNNQILYTTPNLKSSKLVDADLWNANGTQFTLRQLPVGSVYELNMASYNGKLYVVIGSNATNYAYVYVDPENANSTNLNLSPVPYTLLYINGVPDNLSFSNSARFISLQSGSQFAVYDIDQDTHYRYQTNLSLLPSQQAKWMDGNRLYAVSNGKLNIWDFDGTNIVAYTNSSIDFAPSFNQGYDAVYTLLPAPDNTGQWNVMRNSLIANKP